MTQMTEMIDPVMGEIIDEHQIAAQLLAQAKEQGIRLIGSGGLWAGMTKTVLETAPEAEMTEHLGYEKHQVTASRWARGIPRSGHRLPGRVRTVTFESVTLTVLRV